MKKIQLLIISFVLFISNISFAEAQLKYTESGKVMHWEIKDLVICLNAEAKKIPNIENYFIQAIEAWKPAKNFPNMKLGEEFCNIYVGYTDFVCCGNIRPLAINVLTYLQNGEILRADITINKYYKNIMGDATSSSREIYDLPGGIAHELGHAVGLEEDMTNPESIMFNTNFIGKTYKRFIKKGDISALNKIYL